MLKHSVLRVVTLALLTGAGLAACRRPIPPGATPVVDSTAAGGAESAGASGGSASDSAATSAADGTGSLADEEARRVAELRNVLLAPVYFEFDQADLSDQTRAALEQKAAVLRQFESVTVRVAGHTDGRGSDEYNLALGQRRGGIVKRYLMERGIAAARIEVVSYGEERPAAEGDDEAARSQSRRAEFEITADVNFSPNTSRSRTSP